MADGGGAIILDESVINDYDKTFHIADSWKDALVKPKLSKSNILFATCMKELYGPRSLTGTHQGILKALEEGARSTTLAQTYPVNRLKTIRALSSGTNEPLYIPANIKYAIRDSAGISDHKGFSSNIKILGNVADYTDPAYRVAAHTVSGSRFFPDIGIPFIIEDTVFQTMLNKDIITDFKAIINRDYTCTLTCKLGGEPYTANIASDFVAGNDPGAKLMTGNGDKNKWFIEHSNSTSPEIIKEGIIRLICKEFFGDVLMALVALSFKDNSVSYGGDAAIFTGDNALTALSLNLNINVISKSRLKGNKFISDCTAYLFTDDEQLLVKEKQAEIDRIISSNKKFMGELNIVLSMISTPEREIQITYIDSYSIRRNKAKLIGFFEECIEIIKYVNNALIRNRDELVNNGEEFLISSKQELTTSFYIRNFIKSINYDTFTITFMNMHNPFPGWSTGGKEYYIKIITNKMPILAKIQTILTAESSGGQRGGAFTASQIEPPNGSILFNIREHDEEEFSNFISEQEEIDPSSYLIQIIQDVLHKNPQQIGISHTGTGATEGVFVDWIDVYELLFPIFEVSGTICYSPELILYAIKTYLAPEIPDTVPPLITQYHTIIGKPFVTGTGPRASPLPSKRANMQYKRSSSTSLPSMRPVRKGPWTSMPYKTFKKSKIIQVQRPLAIGGRRSKKRQQKKNKTRRK